MCGSSRPSESTAGPWGSKNDGSPKHWVGVHPARRRGSFRGWDRNSANLTIFESEVPRPGKSRLAYFTDLKTLRNF